MTWRHRAGARYFELRDTFEDLLRDGVANRAMRSVTGINRAAMFAVETIRPDGGIVGEDNGHTLAHNHDWGAAVGSALLELERLADDYEDSLVVALTVWIR